MMEGTTRPPPLSPLWKQDPAGPLASVAPISQRRGGDDLPPLAHPDSTLNGRRESSDTQRSGSITHGNLSSLTSPSGSMYPGPPPPYSYHPANTNGAASRNGYISPPDSRDPPGEEKDAGRQSLPSIHEALGKDHSPLYPPPTTQSNSLPPPPPPPSSAPTGYHAQAAASPTQRSYAETHPPAPHAYHHSLPPYSSEPQKAEHHPPYRQGPHEERPAPARPETAPQSYPPPTSSAPPAAQSPHVLHPPQASPTYPPASQSMAPIPPPAYRNYQPAYSYPPPPVNSFAAVNTYPQSQWRQELPEVDDARKAAQKQSPGTPHYGEAVKRHLDIFDLESSLNEMAEGCGRGLDFARHFGRVAHQNHRSGSTLASLPNLQECDDMMKRHERVLASLARIRDFVVAQQHAEQQRSREEPTAPQRPPEYGEDASNSSDKNDRTAGGFAGADAKKRRGRNAPPGRCHSCNRAETPEWRRGPDGARTLCNACGLHYAKLTRKHGAKAGLASSNLRPKENGDS